MRSILLHIHDDPCLDARIQVAFDLARATGGHVTCLQAVPYEYGVPGDIFGPVALQFYPIMQEHAEQLRKKYEERLAKEDVTWDWISEAGTAHGQILIYAGLSDLIVMGARTDESDRPAYSSLAAEIAIDAKTPVLLVPEKCKGFDPSSPAVVAWNGSPEASRTLRAAAPLLRRSRTVYLLTVTDDRSDSDLPATEGASYLARHGIDAIMVELPLSAGGVRETLMHAARAREAGWLVMGAYGHTRLRERILGGVSRSMMTDPELPTMLGH